MELRSGYKQSEIGIIPEAWEVKRLGDIASLYQPQTIPAKQFSKSGFPVYGANGVIGYYHSANHQTWQVTVTCRGSTCGTVNRTVSNCWITGNAMVLNCDQNKGLNKDFFYQLISGQNFSKCITGTGQPQIVRTPLADYRVSVPVALSEQRTIAEALGDVDALLGALDRLIAKKRDLKQAAMQQLLTGQARLPGFAGDWEVKRLGNHVRFLRNGVNSRAELQPEGLVKYLHYGDIHANKDAFISPTMLPSLPMEKAGLLDRLQDGDLVFADASEDIEGVSKSVELRDIGTVEVVSGQHTIAARFDRSILADRFKGLLQFCPTFAAHLRRLAAGTKVYATNRAHIASAEVPLPNTDEQSAISTVLSDMDAELNALVERRAKTMALKQGMMQELLTGRTRLV